ncbi:MAG: hypothetical protein HPY74_11805 [Firmicutes bacterium]|nr:hypothetical protein [Bacillota bacterium]
MVDIHSHILFDVDDGARDPDESLRMVEAAEKAGVKAIITTPHFREHILNPEKTYENYRVLLEKTEGINVSIRLGFEIMLNPVLEKAVDIIGRHSLDGTVYMLAEFPYFTYSEQSLKLLDIMFRQNGFKPIIAHPERVGGDLKSKKTIIKLKEMGCLIQINTGSIVGVYGERIKGMTKYLVKNKIADFVASDAHRESYYSWHEKAYQNVVKWSDEEYAYRLFYENGRKVLKTL